MHVGVGVTLKVITSGHEYAIGDCPEEEQRIAGRFVAATAHTSKSFREYCSTVS